ncbi:hypothetical protein D3C87_1570070 [compost metagenome]
MRHHAGDLVIVESVKQPGRRGDRGILRIATGGKRVRLRAIDHIDARHRQAGIASEVTHDAVIFRGTALIDLLRAVHAQHHLVRVPIGEEVHACGHDEGDHHAAPSANGEAYRHEQGGHDCKQHGGADKVHQEAPGRLRFT